MTYRFGIFEFDDRAAILTRSDRPVALEPQPARALGLLLSRAGEVVTREELRAHLWGGDTHVDFDRGLAYCIGQLRAALGDAADNPRFIQTFPRRGFSVIAPMTAGDGDRSAFGVRGSSFEVRGSAFAVRRSAFAVRDSSSDGARPVDGEAVNDEHRTANDERRTTNAERRTPNHERRTTRVVPAQAPCSWRLCWCF